MGRVLLAPAEVVWVQPRVEQPQEPDAEPADRELETVASWLLGEVGDPVTFFGQVVRRSVDEVLDGPRTGRWDYRQLEKTEKTYVGTKLEIVTRTKLGLEHAGFMDLEIEGIPVDIKWSGTSAWQIPREAVGQLCLCVGALRGMSQFQAGLIRCSEDRLTEGPGNQDGKRAISKVGREAMRFLVPPTPIPPNFVADMDSETRSAVMAEPTIQRRVTRLFESLPGVPIPRDAIRTVAQTEGDPMRRLRADAHAGDPLHGYKVLSAKYGNKVVRALGFQALAKDEFMAVPVADIMRLGPEERRAAGLAD